jgi:hypothetical protein
MSFALPPRVPDQSCRAVRIDRRIDPPDIPPRRHDMRFNIRRNALLVGSAALIAACVGVVNAQPRVVILGSGTAAAVKSDGSQLAGSFNAGSILTIGSTVTPSSIAGFSVAAATPDFSYFAGSNSGGAARWNSSTSSAQNLGLFTTPTPSSGTPAVRSISANGRYIAGWTYLADGSSFRPWVWDATAAGGAGQMVSLPTTANGQAKVVGNDGTVAGVDGCCGSNNRPVVWRFNTATSAWVETALPNDAGAPTSSGGDIYAINSAGTVIVGAVTRSNGDLSTCRWTWNAGTQTWTHLAIPTSSLVRASWLGSSYNPIQLIPTAVSDDGNTIVGIAVYTFFSDFQRGGFTWRSSTGLATDFYDDMVALNAPNIAALGPYDTSSPPALGFPIAMSGDGAHIATYAGPQTGFGPPTLIDLPGGPCVMPTATALNSVNTVAAGSSAYLNCLVTGSEPLTIQWRFNGAPLVDGPSGTGSTYYGATGHGFIGNQLLITGTTPADSGPYDCVVTNPCGTATRPPLTLTVNIGACCHSDGGQVICTIQGSSICTSALAGGLNGIYVGDNTTCASAPCGAVSGACCYYSGGAACVIDVSTHCTTTVANGGNAGAYLGNGTTCSPSACDAVSGACCYSPDGISSVVCSFQLSSHCTQTTGVGGLAGVFAGNGTACAAGASCPAGTVGIGACCFNATALSDIACSVQASSHCTATYFSGGLQGKYEGDGTTCGTSTCRPSTFGTGSSIGACCCTDPANPASGPLCVITFITNCQNYPNGSNDANTAPFNAGLGGNFYANTCCGPSTTPPISGCSTTANCSAGAGACINTPFDNSTPAICTVQVRQSRCERRYNAGGLFGTWVAGAACTPEVLAANAGACCYQPVDGSGNPTGCIVCSIQAQSRCETVNNGGLSGTFAGLGTTCSPLPCDLHVGACCLFASSCVLTCAIDCAANAGTYRGDATTCTPDPCVPSGVCCRGATCSTTTSAGCTVASGLAGAHFVGAGSCGPSPTSPCCHADYNKINGISVQDIFDFLSDWFASNPYANVGGTGAPGPLSVQNIFDFLGDWFAGGC